MSLSDKVCYLLDSIVLLSQIIATMVSTVKSDRNNLSFTIEDILKGEFNWNMYEITPPCHVINICILYRWYFKQNDFLKEELIEYTHANFHHAVTFGRRNIALQIWWLPCNPHRSEWPKTFFGRCICVSNLTTIGSDNGLSPSRRFAISEPMRGYFKWILIKFQTFSFKKMHINVLYANSAH